MRERPAVAGERSLVATLARFRVPLGFVSGLLVLWLAVPTRTSLAVGVAVAAAGELMRIWAAGHLNKSREVTRSGPYRWFAHPLYVGSSVMGAGVAIASDSFGVAVLVGGYLAATLTAAVRSEEAFLRAKFGSEYDRYRSADLRARADERRATSMDGFGMHGPAESRRANASAERAIERRFSVRQVIANREHRAVAGLVLAILLLVLKAAYAGRL